MIAAHTQLTGLLDEYENPAEALMDLYFEQTLTNLTGSVPVYVRGSEIRFDGGDTIVGRLEMIGKPYFRALEPWINGIPDMPEPLTHMNRAIDALDGGPGASCLQLLLKSATIEMFVLTRPSRCGIMNT